LDSSPCPVEPEKLPRMAAEATTRRRKLWEPGLPKRAVGPQAPLNPGVLIDAERDKG